MGENKELGKGYWAPAWRELFHKSAPELFGWPELFSPGWALQIFAAPVRPKGFVWLEFYRGLTRLEFCHRAGAGHFRASDDPQEVVT